MKGCERLNNITAAVWLWFLICDLWFLSSRLVNGLSACHIQGEWIVSYILDWSEYSPVQWIARHWQRMLRRTVPSLTNRIPARFSERDIRHPIPNYTGRFDCWWLEKWGNAKSDHGTMPAKVYRSAENGKSVQKI